MYLIDQYTANEIAATQDMLHPEMRELFQATEEAADEIEMAMRAEVTKRTGLSQVGRAMSIYSPLLLEHQAITSYINASKKYGLRLMAPELLSAEETALVAERDIMLTEQETMSLIEELRSA